MHFLIDTHVHIYSNYDLTILLNTALSNFKRVQQSINKADEVTCALLLTETNQDNAFRELMEKADGQTHVGDWHFEKRSDMVLAAINSNIADSDILIVQGQQVVTQENLELSIWGSSEKSYERKKAKDIIDSALADGASVGVPWGVAKWFGARGLLVLELMNHYGDAISLTDNSGRPIFWLKPQHFKLAASKNVPVFAGSDVLPLPMAEAKVARYLSIFQRDEKLLDKTNLKNILSSHVKNVGSLASPVEFFKDQMTMQVRKHKK